MLLPQLFHLLGLVSGLGTAPGEVFLPMHLPVLLIGLLAGPLAGGAAGLFSPVVSALLTGMPGAALLPFMMVELTIYGVAAGLLRGSRLPVFWQVLLAQIAGRAVRAGAILLAVYGFGHTAVPVAIIWNSIAVGVWGILLQWALLPLLVQRLERRQ